MITDIAWDEAIANASKQCLVTWEVSGGGLMGNLLTDSSTVELSLWSDIVYHVQVTCKHKVIFFVSVFININITSLFIYLL